MNRNTLYSMLLTASVALVACHRGFAGDWPFWGHDASRNMTTDERGLPDDFDAGRYKGMTEEIDMATTRNVKWVAKLGSQAYGNPTVAGGKIFVGTNNESPRNPALQGDRSVVMCFEEKTGKFLWQLVVPKLGAGKVSDWEFLGICSSPAVEGNRVYVVTNRCEVVCLDTEGLSNGNDGPFTDEGQHIAGPGKPPVQVGPTDADIIWVYDMREELGIFPHNITSSSVLVAPDALYVTTSNGVDWSHINIPNPNAPALVKLDKRTGKLLGEEGVGICKRIFHSNWSSPALALDGDQEIIVFGAGDGWCYGFNPKTVKDEEGFDLLKDLWRFDCDPPQYRFKDGKPIKYAEPEGPSECIATPVVYKQRVYIAIGQDPEHGEGVGNLSCIDITKRGDITKSGAVWTYDKIHRSISTVAIADDLVYAADYSGFIHCLDADTGKLHWKYDTLSHIWGSPVVADGKLYIGTEDGDIVILKAGKQMQEIRKVDMRAPVYSSPVIANGVVYIATQTHLYAVGK